MRRRQPAMESDREIGRVNRDEEESYSDVNGRFVGIDEEKA